MIGTAHESTYLAITRNLPCIPSHVHKQHVQILIRHAPPTLKRATKLRIECFPAKDAICQARTPFHPRHHPLACPLQVRDHHEPSSSDTVIIPIVRCIAEDANRAQAPAQGLPGELGPGAAVDAGLRGEVVGEGDDAFVRESVIL